MSGLKLLAIETSSRIGSVALGIGVTAGSAASGGVAVNPAGAVTERSIATPREQTQLVVGLVDELLADAGLALTDLDALVFGRGPGSFTGLRVAAAIAQGLSLASGVPIVSVSSLAALAQRGFAAQGSAGGAASEALCVIDARMGEVYWGRYRLENGLACAVGAERIDEPAALASELAADSAAEAPSVLALGDGFAAYADILAPLARRAVLTDPRLAPTAGECLVLGAVEVAAERFLALQAALPAYLRGADAWT